MTAAMTSGLDVAMVSKKLVRAWEDAYRKYGAASEMTARSRTVDETTASEMARASWAVASAWRGSGGPWLQWSRRLRR